MLRDMTDEEFHQWIGSKSEKEINEWVWKGSPVPKVMPDFVNPGQMPVGESNPELSAEIDEMRKLRDRFNPMFDQIFDDGRFNQRRGMLLAENSARLGNQFAGMGLEGSSLAMGSLSESSRRLGMELDDQRLNQAMSAGQFQMGLGQSIQAGLIGAQNIFSEFQRQQMQLIAAQMAAEAGTEAAIWGAAGTIGGGIAGGLMGGPAGAFVGATAGGQLGRGMRGGGGGGAMQIDPAQSHYSLGDYTLPQPDFSNTGFVNPRGF